MPEQFLHGVEVVEIDDGIRSIQTVKSSIIGLIGTADAADAGAFPLDTPVLVAGPRQAALLGVDGTLKDAYEAIYAQGVSVAVIVRVAEGVDDATTLANAVGDATAQTGAFAFLTAATVTGQTPRILAGPGLTKPADPAVKNALTAGLVTIADQLRAVVVADGPNTTEANALTYANLFGDQRLYLVDPAVTVFDDVTATNVTRPASGYVAGVISRTDNERGFWWSPSNRLIGGIIGVSRPISFGISNPDTEANRLNEAKVATIIRSQGFRLWGNRAMAGDAQWAFLSVRRTADLVYDSIERAHLWALDRPFSAQLMLDVRDSVQAYVDRLTGLGALLGGTVWIDAELNTEATLKAGQLFINFDIEPPAPLEKLTFQARRNGTYYDELISDVTNA